VGAGAGTEAEEGASALTTGAGAGVGVVAGTTGAIFFSFFVPDATILAKV